ncbi:GNAT family N-acetyltransferase [Microvirga arsenatis]|uniref:GNAT family N-acetyltransferase n=1 Tax=Microvirga arsenatis TaxID=2692265 RepID=A0ABW9Z2K9_9HYPH|nr:GNAT family N-acetyltransferase [Microvirga arsenatis]NBJ13016.1 GNAT family N-acetyltransferase [Microvirga arsenatis]NBJ26760.1 GNAT family N-acetyltransferase [Microvirga arsenatis]
MLRCPRYGDGARLYEAIRASLPELKPWLVWVQKSLDTEGYEASLRQAASRFLVRQELRYLIFDATQEILLGSTGFHALDWRIPKAEIGYWIDTRHAGQGYVTEAVEALTKLGLNVLGFRRIEIRSDALNERSHAVARRLNYQLDGRLVNNSVAADDPSCLRDTLVFSRVS